MLKKIFPLLLFLVALTSLSAAAPDTVTFVGTIEEIAMKTSVGPMGTMGGMEKNLAIKLDSKPKLDIRVTYRDAARFGLIDTDQPSAVLTPGKIKGVGWKVRLTCNKKTTASDPFYMVTKLERMD